MKRCILNIWFIILPFFAFTQIHFLSDQYVFNALAINPAFAGSKDALCISLLHRNQWIGFEGAPKTMTVSIHTSIRNENTGLGILFINDKIGVSNQTSLSGNYAYRIDMGNGKLAFGIAAALSVNNTNWSELAKIDLDDEQLLNNSPTTVLPNFSTGVYYKTGNYFLGLSIPSLLSNVFDPATKKNVLQSNFSEYNYFLCGGYIFKLKQDFEIFPSTLIKYQQGNKAQIDINAQLIYSKKFWLGATYRSNKSLVSMLQFQLNDQFRVAYSYGLDLGKLSKFNTGSHEIMLHYEFSYLVEVIGPRNF